MSYIINIHEYQRKIIEIALRNLSPEAIAEVEIPSFEDGPAETIQSLLEMTADLPAVEAAHPGILHGFAL